MTNSQEKLSIFIICVCLPLLIVSYIVPIVWSVKPNRRSQCYEKICKDKNYSISGTVIFCHTTQTHQSSKVCY